MLSPHLRGEAHLLRKLLKYWAIFCFMPLSKISPGQGTRHRKAAGVSKAEGCDAKSCCKEWGQSKSGEK